MKINWNPNPFFTTVELDERDKEQLLKVYQCEKYEDLFCDLSYQEKYHPETYTFEYVKEKLKKWEKICNLEVTSDEFKRLEYYLEDIHGGDCTCVPCSCMRCHVENLLGIDTLEGCGKHLAYKVDGAFSFLNETTGKREYHKDIDKAIACLADMSVYDEKPNPDNFPGGYDKWVPKWKAERQQAHDWLVAYKEKYGF
jgi:hypothetical protein